MSLLLRILLIPCLAPLMAVLLLSMMHRGDPTRLRVLAWESPPLPIGVWTAIGASGGALIGGGIALLLKPSRLQLRRTLHQQSWAGRSDDSNHSKQQPVRGPSPGPERDLRDPAPTVAVPFRVIQRPVSNSADSSRKPGAGTSHEAGISHEAGTSPEAGTVMESSQSSGGWGDDPARNW